MSTPSACSPSEVALIVAARLVDVAGFSKLPDWVKLDAHTHLVVEHLVTPPGNSVAHLWSREYLEEVFEDVIEGVHAYTDATEELNDEDREFLSQHLQVKNN